MKELPSAKTTELTTTVPTSPKQAVVDIKAILAGIQANTHSKQEQLLSGLGSTTVESVPVSDTDKVEKPTTTQHIEEGSAGNETADALQLEVS